MWALKLVANVVFPAAAGFVVTLHLLLPLVLRVLPGVQPSAMMVILLTGFVTMMICHASLASRRLIRRVVA